MLILKKLNKIKASLSQRAKLLSRNVPILFLCLKDSQTPAVAKLTALITVVYALSPIDFIPDFIPVLGYLDDLIILPALITLTVKLIPKSVWDNNAKKAEGMWTDGKPKKWYYAIPTVIVWFLIAFVIIKAIIKNKKSGVN